MGNYQTWDFGIDDPFGPNDDWVFTTSYVKPPPDPNKEGQMFLNSLSGIHPSFVKEIIVKESIYKQILAIWQINVPDQPEYMKSTLYHSRYGGHIVLKNEKHQFDLDKYIEDFNGPEVSKK